METIANYINGEFVPSNSGSYMDVFEPATGQVYAQVPDSKNDDVESAVKAGSDGFESWSKTSPVDRSQIMHRIADGLENRLVEFAKYESRDTGKPVSLAKLVDIPRAVSNFRFFANIICIFINIFTIFC